MKLLLLFLTQQLIAVSSSNPTSFFQHVVKDHTCKDKSQTCGDDQTCCPFGDGFVDLLVSRSSDFIKHTNIQIRML